APVGLVHERKRFVCGHCRVAPRGLAGAKGKALAKTHSVESTAHNPDRTRAARVAPRLRTVPRRAAARAALRTVARAARTMRGPAAAQASAGGGTSGAV